MGFRNEAQKVAACRALCALGGAPALWTDEGPTPAACEVLELAGPPISTLLAVAFDLWDGTGGARWTALTQLEPDTRAPVAALLGVFDGPEEYVAAWLEKVNGRGAGDPDAAEAKLVRRLSERVAKAERKLNHRG
jgi:hypothetical protein